MASKCLSIEVELKAEREKLAEMKIALQKWTGVPDEQLIEDKEYTDLLCRAAKSRVMITSLYEQETVARREFADSLGEGC